MESVRTTVDDVGNDLLCPVCKINLMMSERQGIEIDYCNKCRGVWLDRGELDKIIDQSGQSENRGSQTQATSSGERYEGCRDRGSHYGGHGSTRSEHGGGFGHGRRQGSFLGRLFD